MMKTAIISHNDFTAIDFRKELSYRVTVITNTKILHDADGNPWFHINETKSNSQPLTVVFQFSFLLFLPFNTQQNLGCVWNMSHTF